MYFKSLLFIVISSISTQNQAQITVTSNQVPQIGHIFQYHGFVNPQINPFLTGQNQTWDYSNLIIANSSISNTDYVNPVDASAGSLFPSSSHVESWK